MNWKKQLVISFMFSSMVGTISFPVYADLEEQIKTSSDAIGEEQEYREHSWRYNDEFYEAWTQSQGELTIPNYYAVENAWGWNGEYYINSLGERIPNVAMRGIDVSHWQEIIDWDKVAGSGVVEFAIINCGHGKTDATCKRNLEEANRVGLSVGAYVYTVATTVKEAQEEAYRVLDTIKDYRIDMPVYFDIEDDRVLQTIKEENPTLAGQRATYARLAKTFCDIIREAGYTPGVYASNYFWNQYLTDSVFQNPHWHHWYARWAPSLDYEIYNSNGELKSWDIYKPEEENYIWQCTDNARVPGIDGGVDINFVIDTGIDNADIFKKRVPHILQLEFQVQQKQVILQWQDIRNEDGYEVYRKEAGNNTWTRIKTLDCNVNSYIDEKIEFGKTYFYTVRGYRTCNGVLTRTNYESTFSCETGLATPVLKKAFAMADGTIVVEWESVRNAQRYYLYRKTTDTSWQKIAIVDGVDYQDNEVVAGKKYLYTVRAYCKETGLGDYEKVGISVTAKKMTEPTLLEAREEKGNAITVNWQGISDVDGYYIYRKTSESGWKKIASVGKNVTSYTDTKASYGVNYAYTVRAVVNYAGYTSLSNYVSKGISATSMVDTPNLQNAYAMADGSVVVTWDKVVDADVYYVYRKVNGGSWERLSTNVTNTSYQDKTAKAGTSYIYTVRAYDKESKQLSSYVKAGVSATAKKFVTPALVRATETAGASITVEWKAVAGITNYYVYRKTEGSSWKRIAEVSSGVTSYQDKNAEYGKTYFYTVRGVTSYAGINALTGYVSAGISATCMVDTPALTRATVQKGVGITVTWSKVIDADNYYVYRKVAGGSWTRLTSSATGTSYQDKTAKAGTTYIYTVRAYDKETKQLSNYVKTGISATAK